MSFTHPDAAHFAALVLWSLLFGFTAWWLKGTLTADRFLTLFESEGVLSMRLALAAVVVVFTLCMQAAGRLSTAKIEINYLLAGTLLGLGTAKVVGKAFAKRAGDTTVNTKKIEGGLNAEKMTVNQPITGTTE